MDMIHNRSLAREARAMCLSGLSALGTRHSALSRRSRAHPTPCRACPFPLAGGAWAACGGAARLRPECW
eukprot:scaffold65444_cov59-Phaeocystis_antarctica.AAC.1